MLKWEPRVAPDTYVCDALITATSFFGLCVRAANLVRDATQRMTQHQLGNGPVKPGWPGDVRLTVGELAAFPYSKWSVIPGLGRQRIQALTLFFVALRFQNSVRPLPAVPFTRSAPLTHVLQACHYSGFIHPDTYSALQYAYYGAVRHKPNIARFAEATVGDFINILHISQYQGESNVYGIHEVYGGGWLDGKVCRDIDRIIALLE